MLRGLNEAEAKAAMRLAREIWEHFRERNARVIRDRRGRPNFIVALALARYIVWMGRHGYDPDHFDTQYLIPELTHRENIDELHRKGILPPPPPPEEKPTKVDEALQRKREYEELITSDMLPRFGPLVGETRDAQEYREALDLLKRMWEGDERATMKKLLELRERRREEIQRFVLAGKHWGPVVPDTKTSSRFHEMRKRLKKSRKGKE